MSFAEHSWAAAANAIDLISFLFSFRARALHKRHTAVILFYKTISTMSRGCFVCKRNNKWRRIKVDGGRGASERDKYKLNISQRTLNILKSLCSGAHNRNFSVHCSALPWNILFFEGTALSLSSIASHIFYFYCKGSILLHISFIRLDSLGGPPSRGADEAEGKNSPENIKTIKAYFH